MAKITFILSKGHSGIQLLNQIFDYIVQDDTLSEVQKKHNLKKIASCEIKLSDGSDELLHLTNLLLSLN
jgi:DNA polymerase III delta prime subunit